MKYCTRAIVSCNLKKENKKKKDFFYLQDSVMLTKLHRTQNW